MAQDGPIGAWEMKGLVNDAESVFTARLAAAASVFSLMVLLSLTWARSHPWMSAGRSGAGIPGAVLAQRVHRGDGGILALGDDAQETAVAHDRNHTFDRARLGLVDREQARERVGRPHDAAMQLVGHEIVLDVVRLGP